MTLGSIGLLGVYLAVTVAVKHSLGRLLPNPVDAAGAAWPLPFRRGGHQPDATVGMGAVAERRPRGRSTLQPRLQICTVPFLQRSADSGRLSCQHPLNSRDGSGGKAAAALAASSAGGAGSRGGALGLW